MPAKGKKIQCQKWAVVSEGQRSEQVVSVIYINAHLELVYL